MAKIEIITIAEILQLEPTSNLIADCPISVVFYDAHEDTKDLFSS